MAETANDGIYYAIEHRIWWDSLRVLTSEHDRNDDVYIGFLINHMRIAESIDGFRLLFPEDYDYLIKVLGMLCEAFERPYVEGILEALLNATIVTGDGVPVDAQ
ncbi:hypothetical protein [Kaistia terrae]|uniref:Uncharacterized protein n=1 Tax=Kaistia terrae TaxID=537017 RepID=A0ABW0PY76_9HYPH|nr:hypothetical protein [Kaistia terrae]MCX5580969.1 hypothetical protein [Kaistia terrae]